MTSYTTISLKTVLNYLSSTNGSRSLLYGSCVLGGYDHDDRPLNLVRGFVNPVVYVYLDLKKGSRHCRSQYFINKIAMLWNSRFSPVVIKIKNHIHSINK